MVESLEQRLHTMGGRPAYRDLQVALTTKLVRQGQLFLDDLQKLKVGTLIWSHHDGSPTAKQGSSQYVFLGLGESNCGGKTYQVYKYRHLHWVPASGFLDSSLADSGVIPYDNGTWNHYNWLSLEPHPNEEKNR